MMKITQLTPVDENASPLYFNIEHANIKSIKFNKAMTGDITSLYEYSTYEIEFDGGDVIIVPSDKWVAVYRK